MTQPPPAGFSPEKQPQSSSPTIAVPAAGRAGLVFIIMAVLQAALTTFVITHHGEVYNFRDELAKAGGSIDDTTAVGLATSKALRNNAIVGVSMTGASLAALFGLATGLVYRSGLGAILGFVVGAVLGGALGWAGSTAETVLLEKYVSFAPDADPLVNGIAGHVLAWIVVAIAVGLSTGLASQGRVSPLRTTGAAVLAGILSGMLYGPIASLLFWRNKTDSVLPDGNLNLAFWTGLTGLLTALMLAWTIGYRPSDDNVSNTSKPAG